MHDPELVMDVYTSNSYRKFGGPTGTTGTLGDTQIKLLESSHSGGPVWPNEKSEAGTRGRGPATALFVETTLDSWSTDQPQAFARDVQTNDTAYRRLDPEYYAWLRSRMNLVKSAHRAGQVDAKGYEALRSKFNTIHEWAMEHLDKQALSEAVRNLDARNYRPPTIEPDTTAQTGKSAVTGSGLANSLALVDAIAEKALASGWKHERLYRTGPLLLFSPNRGLVSYLKRGDRIGEVTAQSIEIIRSLPSDVCHRFYNPDVEQPWIRRLRP